MNIIKLHNLASSAILDLLQIRSKPHTYKEGLKQGGFSNRERERTQIKGARKREEKTCN
jgi:hypothetical protein